MIDVLEYCVSEVARVFTESPNMVLLRIKGILNIAAHLHEVHGVTASIRCHIQNVREGSILCLLVVQNLWLMKLDAVLGIDAFARLELPRGSLQLLRRETHAHHSSAEIAPLDCSVLFAQIARRDMEQGLEDFEGTLIDRVAGAGLLRCEPVRLQRRGCSFRLWS